MVQLLLLAYLGLVPVACIAGLVALVRHSWWLVYCTFMLQALNVLIGIMAWIMNVLEAGKVEKALKGGKP